MVVIEVKEEDLDKVFEILSNNGRFIGLSNNRFQVSERAEEVLKKIEERGIKIKIIDENEVAGEVK